MGFVKASDDQHIDNERIDLLASVLPEKRLVQAARDLVSAVVASPTRINDDRSVSKAIDAVLQICADIDGFVLKR